MSVAGCSVKPPSSQLALHDLRPGDMLTYMNHPFFSDNLSDLVLVYIKPHDSAPERTWDMGVFLTSGGEVIHEMASYLRKV